MDHLDHLKAEGIHPLAAFYDTLYVEFLEFEAKIRDLREKQTDIDEEGCHAFFGSVYAAYFQMPGAGA